MKRTALTTGTILAVSLACGTDTGRRRTTFDLEVRGINRHSTNAHGWEVELTKAEVDLGQLSFFEGDPLFSQALRAVLVSRAYAHPGHYMEGDALAELLAEKRFDLLGAPTLFGVAEGVTGDYNSAEIRLTGVTLEGVARKDGVEVRFAAEVTEERDIRGIAFGAPVRAATGHVDMMIDLSRWLDRADFTGVTDGPLTSDQQPYRALVRGLVNTESFIFERKETSP